MEDLSIYRKSDLLHTQEEMTKYRPGGFHPVCLDDTFKDGRYKIRHKLGWGGYSTVWLAKDKMRKQWVAIKIMTANSSKGTAELRHLRSLAALSQQSTGFKYIVKLLDDFPHVGPNGSHQCLVFELLGPSVSTVIEDYHKSKDRLEPETILKMSRQLLQAIAFLHREGYAHGDLSGGNVAFTSTRLSKLPEKKLFKIIGSPPEEPVELARLDGKPLNKGLPSHLIEAAGWDNWIDEDDEDLRIIDLGVAFMQGAEPTTLAQPGPLRVPETIFTSKFDYRLDLWRAGIMIYSFIFGALPFLYAGDVDVLVAQMVNFVEALPDRWWDIFKPMREKSKREWKHLAKQNLPPKSKLEQKFHERVHENTLKPLLPVIKGLMRFRPEDRISASQALELLKG